MNNKVIFIVFNDRVEYCIDGTKDHKALYTSFGLREDTYDACVKGFVEKGKIIFYNNFFTYDDSVIKAAKEHGQEIRDYLQNQELDIYCGLQPNGPNDYDPIYKIDSAEKKVEHAVKDFTISKVSTGFNVVTKEDKKEEVQPVQNTEPTEPLIKNNYNDENFVTKFINTTIIVLIITIIIKVILGIMNPGRFSTNTYQMIMIFLSLASLSATIVLLKSKPEFKKYGSYPPILASIFLILLINIPDIILGIFYLLYSIDASMFSKLLKKDK